MVYVMVPVQVNESICDPSGRGYYFPKPRL